MFGRKKRVPLSRSAVWLCSGHSHQRCGTYSASTTVIGADLPLAGSLALCLAALAAGAAVTWALFRDLPIRNRVA